jgi:hypothetical protein
VSPAARDPVVNLLEPALETRVAELGQVLLEQRKRQLVVSTVS